MPQTLSRCEVIASVYGVASDQGSVVLFNARDDHDYDCIVAVDHRVAQDLVDVLQHESSVDVEAEPWQIARRLT